MPDWQLLVLSPVNTPYDFFKGTPAHVIPHIIGSPQLIRAPVDLPAAEPRGAVALPPCWQRSPPSYHAFGWVYRAPLMAKLAEGFRLREPALEPLDIWVWELMAAHGVLDKALCTSRPLVRAGVRPGGTDSIKDQQDGERPPESNPTHARRRPPRSAPRRARPSAADPKFLANLYRERGYGQGDVNKQPAPPAALRPGLDAPAS